MTYETLKIEEKGRIVSIVLNRPDIRNAFDAKMISDLTSAFIGLSKRDDVSAIILRGEGKSFSAGADLGYMKSMASFSLEENQRDAESLDRMFWAIRECPQPVIGRIHGHAMGGALGLASVCDIVAAVDGTQFAFSEVRIGLAPAVISPYVLEKMAVSEARRYMLSGEVFDCEEAYSSGLIQFYGTEQEVDEFVAGTSTTIDRNGIEAVRATKKLLRDLDETGEWGEKRALTTKVIAARRVSAEGQEGLKAFLEKRSPSWMKSGK
ncbi:MAG TPA: enoyl-CoA hydratase-related protein [Bdellovibrionales bacterium]|nr:enoyl-CoA hydratase-related protein [Bdellovibrionales bacterium]